MRRFLLLLTMLIGAVGMSWGTDYSKGYYTVQCGTYFTMYAANSGNSGTYNYGGTSTGSSAVVFTFEKTTTDGVYYWYDTKNHKYIHRGTNDIIEGADTKDESDNGYKWFIKANSDGTTVTICDMADYNDGNPTLGLAGASNSAGGWLKAGQTLSSNTSSCKFTLTLLIQKNKMYYMELGRGDSRCLTYGGDNNNKKLQQTAATTKGINHMWYVTDVANGYVNLRSLASLSPVGYSSGDTKGADKIAINNSLKKFTVVYTGNTSYPVAFLTSELSSNLYISNYGGTGNANMGLYGTLNDAGTYMKMTEVTLSELQATKTTNTNYTRAAEVYNVLSNETCGTSTSATVLGLPSYSLYSTLKTAYNNTSVTLDDLNAACANFTSATLTNTVQDGKYYRILNASDEGSRDLRYGYTDGSVMYSIPYASADMVKSIIRFESSDSHFNLRTQDGKFIQGYESQDTQYKTGTSVFTYDYGFVPESPYIGYLKQTTTADHQYTLQ